MRNRDRAVPGSSSSRDRAASASASGPLSAWRRTGTAARRSGSSMSSNFGDTERSARAISAWARKSPLAKRRGASADGAPGASISARSARRSNCSETLSAAGLLTRHFAEPAGVVQPGPGPRHRTARDGAERARLPDGPEIDVEDDRHHEEDEGDVVDDVARLPEDLVEREREPHDETRHQEPDGTGDHGPEEHLLAGVVLPHLRVVALIAHVLDEPWPYPALLLLRHAHLGCPVQRHPEGEDEEGDARPRVQPAADVESADQRRHPPEHGRPDGEAREQAEEERQRDQPVGDAHHQPVADDDVADHDVLVALSAQDALVDRGMDDASARVRR